MVENSTFVDSALSVVDHHSSSRGILYLDKKSVLSINRYPIYRIYVLTDFEFIAVVY